MNYLKSYENEAAYLADATEARMKSGDFLLPNVSFVKDTKTVHFNKYREFPPPAMGDIYVTDGTNNWFVDKDTYIATLADDSTITPIGVVVIPASHTEDNKTRVISCWGATTYQYGEITSGIGANVYWGSAATQDVPQSSLTNYVNRLGTTVISSTTQRIIGTNIPLPYTSSYNKNDIYFYNTVVGGVDFSTNALSDLNGEENTDIITNRVTVSNWESLTKTISNSTSSGNYPAACIAKRYYTPGTNKGDWYLPSIGELGYLGYSNDINSPVNASMNALTNKAVALGYDLWSSTEIDGTVHKYVSGYNAFIKVSKTSGTAYVRPFLKV